MDPNFALEQAMLSHQYTIKKAIALGDTPVQKFYEGSVIFVTGGSGFLGKLLIEKLLRTCAPSKIYILIRHKKNKTPNDRLIEVLEDPIVKLKEAVMMLIDMTISDFSYCKFIWSNTSPLDWKKQELFETLRKQEPNFAQKLVVIQGDVGKIDLGISSYEWERLSSEVNVIFHVAANVRFDVEMKAALLSNARGTREALRLAADCTQLRAFVYVSTAFSHATWERIDGTVSECFYDPPAPPDAMIKLAETMSVEKLQAMTPALIKGWPNTYTFSKAIAEEIVRTNSKNLPVCIIRPTIVSSTNLDPVPGWLDMSCAYGPSGLILGVAFGISHVAHINKNIKLDLIPADIVTNSIIGAAWETACKRDVRDQPPKIYTVSSSKNAPLFGTIVENFLGVRKTLAVSEAVWYNFLFETKYKFMYNLMSIFLHYIPAYFVDAVCLLLGKPRMFVNIYKKVDKLANALSYFTNNQWLFEVDNLQNLFKSLSPIDKQIFDMDVTAIDWKKNHIFWIIGVRKYLVKESEKLCEYALKKQKVLKVIHYIVSALYLFLIWKFINLCLYLLFKVFY